MIGPPQRERAQGHRGAEADNVDKLKHRLGYAGLRSEARKASHAPTLSPADLAAKPPRAARSDATGGTRVAGTGGQGCRFDTDRCPQVPHGEHADNSFTLRHIWEPVWNQTSLDSPIAESSIHYNQ